MCVIISMSMLQHLCGGQRTTLGFGVLPSVLLRQGFSSSSCGSSAHSRIAGPQTSRWFPSLNILSCCSNPGIADVNYCIWLFVSSGDLSQVISLMQQLLLPSELSYQPKLLFLFKRVSFMVC